MKYNCPICQVEMTEQIGETMHPGNPAYGITLSCLNPNCSAQEVMGHGKNVKEAWEVVQEKFIVRKERT